MVRDRSLASDEVSTEEQEVSLGETSDSRGC